MTRLQSPAEPLEQPESSLCETLLPLAHARILERGGGRAEATRAIAFEPLQRAVASARFELVCEHFFAAPVAFESFAEFERRVSGVTHTQHRLTPAQLHATRAASHAMPAPTVRDVASRCASICFASLHSGNRPALQPFDACQS